MEKRTIQELLVPGVVATALTATKPRFVTGEFDAVDPVTATSDVVIGINEGDGGGTFAAAVDDVVTIALSGSGIREVELGDTVSAIFTELTHDSVGRAVPWAAGRIAHVLALATGVVGDIIPVLFVGRSTAIADVTATAAEINILDDATLSTAELNQLDGAILADMTPGTGISTGVATICEHTVIKVGGLFKTTILLDLTGLNSGGTAGDVIGKDGATANCHIGRILAAVNGTIIAGRITCHETPAGGDPDVDLWGNITEATLAQDTAISAATGEAQLINHGDWTAGEMAVLTALPAANGYLYLACGDATDADYSAGIFVIELWGK